MNDPLERIAQALERIAPPLPDAADPLAHPAYLWREHRLVAVRAFQPLPLDHLIGIDAQRAAVTDNFRRLAAGHAAQDVLLWGARGSGKSALVAAAIGAVQGEGGRLALVQAAADRLDDLPALFALLAGAPRAYVVFLDDLGFDGPAEARALRSLLEGGAEARPANVRLMVTANRRHLMPRDPVAEAAASNPRDAADDALALADRFGLALGFHAIDQAGYLEIVRSYTAAHGLPYDAEDAVRWALQRGSRSGRVAWQYIVDLAGRSGRAL